MLKGAIHALLTLEHFDKRFKLQVIHILTILVRHIDKGDTLGITATSFLKTKAHAASGVKVVDDDGAALCAIDLVTARHRSRLLGGNIEEGNGAVKLKDCQCVIHEL